MKSLLLTAAVILAPLCQSSAIDYKTHILPIFRENCFNCHGDGKDKGSVRLDMEYIKKEMKFTIFPGEPIKSPIYDVLVTPERDLKMPPPGKGTLTEREKQLVHDWIAQGAKIEGSDPGTAVAATPKPDAPAPIAGKWENHEGKIITATLMRVEGTNAILKIADGREIPYPIAKLSPASQAKVKEFAESAGG